VNQVIEVDEPATQALFGSLVGISQQAVSDAALRGVLEPGATLGQWLIGYCGHLRDVAAGRGGDDQFNLTQARARQAIADATLKELDYLERVGELVAVQDLEPRLASWAVAIRAELENAIARVVAHIESKHAIEIDQAALEGIVCAALDAAAAHPLDGDIDAVAGVEFAEEAKEDRDA
jgi:phage terminase Nu1 subunit (DNA packaging protein)